jgi:hypothetical protein
MLAGPVGLAAGTWRRFEVFAATGAALPPVVAAARAVPPVVWGGEAAGGPVRAPAHTPVGQYAGEFTHGFVVDVPDGRVGAGGLYEAAQLGDGASDAYDTPGVVVPDRGHVPHPHPLHPTDDRTPAGKAVKRS